jgi:putative hydrolase of the HAD superfamily
VTEVLGVVFDFYGTLVEEHPDDAERDRQVLAERGYHLSGAVQRAWVDPFTALDHRDDSADRQRYQRRRSELWRIALAEAGVDAEHLDELAALAETCDATRRYVAYPDVVDALAHLRARGLGTAICSNWGWDLAQTVAATGLDGRVDAVVTSAQAGFRKPHPGVFSTVADALGSAPEHLLFVGDTWHADVEGPVAAGMRAAHLVRSPEGEAPLPPLPPGIVRIGGLDELPTLLSP